MADSVIQQFLKAVVHDHALATGLKTCTTQVEITAYAASQAVRRALRQREWAYWRQPRLSRLRQWRG